MDYSTKQLAQTLQNYVCHKREKEWGGGRGLVFDENTKGTLS